MPQNRLEYNRITGLIGARCRVGFEFAIRVGAMPRLFLTRRVPESTLVHVVDNNLRLLTEGLGLRAPAAAIPLELHLTPEEHRTAERWLRDQGLASRPLIGLHPGTGTTKNLALRRRPAERWAELARMLAARTPERAILLFGGPAERDLRETIRGQAGLPPDRLLDAPAGGIRDAAALMARLQCLVCTDTLLTHMGAALGVPQVVIMGPTPHTSVYPYGVPHRIVRLGMVCSPCYGYSRHGIRCTHPQPLACLTGIATTTVAAAVCALLEEANRPAT